MKIILFPKLRNKSGESALKGIGQDTFLTLPDTTVLGTKVPFFVPDFAEHCKAHFYVAVRVSRLGRSINRQFAHRYYDAVTLAVHFTAHPLLEDLRREGLPWNEACAFDSASALGAFQLLDGTTDLSAITGSFSLNGNIVATLPPLDVAEEVDRLVEVSSAVQMYRQGDVLLLGKVGEGVQVAIDDHLSASLNGKQVLSFNVK